MTAAPPILVIGLGNPILGDDGVGWRVAGAVRAQLAEQPPPQPVEIDCVALGGLSLMERMVGYDRAIVIDATQTGRPAGSVAQYDLEALPDYASFNSTAPHDASLQTALRLGRAMGVRLPTAVLIVGIEAEQLYDFSETLTPAVAAAVPAAAQTVIAAVYSFFSEEQPHGVA